MSEIEIRQFGCRSDNFGVLVHMGETTIAIDAPEERPIVDTLQAEGWTLTHVLTTHHHQDHVEANEALKARFGARIIGPKDEAAKIPGIDETVEGGRTLDIGGIEVQVIATPGHTLGEVSYYLPGAPALFAADALFSLGCGRLFEGDPAMMWASLQRLRALPDETMLYCGHEYTATNVRFALDLDPANLLIHERASEVEHLRTAGKPTLPIALGKEKKTNPFLRVDEPAFQKAVGMEGADPVEVFAHARKIRDGY
ncbi:hydroxyacylglutathione hydrolase [Fulvimarina sp. 2208YS6-2-32]|uniref:Hydroxyacylglutathione hydrolase n=1 Tax=Fulvimarina uroteuthidis TaxID=3098149 RepID=A0ABU5HYV9_9HYPH|nr:hydroxyacylglutathione hydrolase [Fulvimarina sp. 2208YS6-2-32]MDY8108230.1 hydroxyacylglutathione hydrolase [Fulvimarina sp. 2208YS6-2-32]